MAEIKPPMTNAYKAVFIFSILMAVLCFLDGIGSVSKGKIGTILWCYAAWLMYKRNNAGLITLFKTLMWFEIIVGGFGIVCMLFLDINELVGLGILIYSVILIIGITISYSLLVFFQKQSAPFINQVTANEITQNTQTSNDNESKYWEQALNEFNSDARNKALWAKSFAECGGDDKKAQAEYLKSRFNELAFENKIASANINLRVNGKESAPAKEYGVYFGIFLIVVLVVLLIFNVRGTNNVSSYFINRTNTIQPSAKPAAPIENKTSESKGG